MRRTLISLALLLVTGACCEAQTGLMVRGVGKQVWQADAQKIYQSASLAVQREFRIVESIRPAITLTVGTHENAAYADSKEIRLVRWNPDLFAQGVVAFAFDELLPKSKRLAVAERAVIWANSVIDANSLGKQHPSFGTFQGNVLEEMQH